VVSLAEVKFLHEVTVFILFACIEKLLQARAV
jgi:hypothetical protein